MSEGTLRPGNKAMIERWNWLLAFWREKKRGPYKEDFADFCIEFGLTDRTARESYWDRAEVKGIIRAVYEKKVKYWEYSNADTHAVSEKPRTEGHAGQSKSSNTLGDIINRRILRQKMLAGPCAHECSLPEDADCRQCITYRSLRNKDFLGDQEGA